MAKANSSNIKQLCRQCRTCIYQWAESCPGLVHFSRNECCNVNSN